MSGRHWTPYEIKIILHHAHGFAPFPEADAPLYQPTVGRLMQMHVMEYRDGIARCTDIGMAFVELLLQTPLPRAVIIDPRSGKEIMPENPTPTLDRTIKAAREGLDWLAPTTSSGQTP